MNVVFDTLSYMAKLDRMNQWVYKKVKPYLGQRVLEAGCGNGNLTAQLLDKKLVVAVDNDQRMLDEIKARFSHCDNLKTVKYNLADPGLKAISAANIDTIVCINTLEHIEDDAAVLRNFNAILEQGNLIILVPVIKSLYCSLDRAAGHQRRYELKELTDKLGQAGFIVNKSMFANFFGIFGWFINGKLLKRQNLSRKLLSLFNYLMPLLELIEKLIGPPCGLSVIVVCNKK